MLPHRGAPDQGGDTRSPDIPLPRPAAGAAR